MVENNIDDMALGFREEVRKSDYMITYHELSDEELLKKARNVFENLIKWIISPPSQKNVGEYFSGLGAERLREGFPLSEVNYALYLSKKVFWKFTFENYNKINGLDNRSLIEFIHELNNYFDIGEFFIIRGYLEELFSYLGNTGRFSKEELESFLVKGALYKETVRTIKDKLDGGELGFTK